MTDTLERVRKIVVEQLGCDDSDVEMGTSIVDDLNADSLDIVELVMAVENEFEVKVSDEHAEKIKTIGDIVRYVEENQ